MTHFPNNTQTLFAPQSFGEERFSQRIFDEIFE
jgi:hypothetical protein